MRISWSRIFIEEVDKGKIESKYKVLRLEILMFALFILWLLGGFATYYWFGDDRGTTGDMFGTVNALFSGLAFAGIIYTILLQRTELKFQREELELQRAEIKRSGDELEGQKNLMAIQRFENTFFQLVNLNHEIVRNMSVSEIVESFDPSLEKFEGREVFERFYIELTKVYSLRLQVKKEAISKDYVTNATLTQKQINEIHKGIAIESFEHVYKEYEDLTGHYFRNLYHTIRWVHNANYFVSDDEKKEYIRIIRAQLSTYELLVIYYNCTTDQGTKMGELATKYNLFDNMNYSLLINEEHKDFYYQ